MSDPSATAEGSELTTERLDALFAALADEHRRDVLCYFHTTRDDVASVSDLVDNATERGDATRDTVKLAYHHNTLPALADLGIVEYEKDGERVRYRGPPGLQRILTVAVELDMLAE